MHPFNAQAYKLQAQEDLAALQWLETLDLTDNCFGTFPLPVLELGSLTHLFIGANSLPRLPELSALEMLASIDVGGNSLKELNPSIWELPRLRELRAADNDIAELRVEEGASFLPRAPRGSCGAGAAAQIKAWGNQEFNH